jgi:hypothetical protein
LPLSPQKKAEGQLPNGLVESVKSKTRATTTLPRIGTKRNGNKWFRAALGPDCALAAGLARCREEKDLWQ